MAEIRLKKRYKYAGDIMPKLLDIGFDIETANDFLNSIEDADVAPRAEVARELLDEMEKTIRWALTLVGLSYKHNFKEIQCRKECYEDFLGYIAELKKKLTECEK